MSYGTDKPHKVKDPEGRETEESSSKTLNYIVAAICIVFSLIGILTNSVYPLTGIKKGGIFMGFTLCLIFLLYPTKIKGKRLIWYDAVLAVLGLVSGFYTYLVTDRFSLSNLQMTNVDFVMSIIAVTLVILAARRAVGNAMALLPIVFALYAIFGKHIPGILGHNGYSVRRFFMRMYMVDEGLYGMTTQVATSYVFLFIVFGAFLASSGVAEFFTDAANRIAGAKVGGPAKVAVISSGLMGTISGSSAANVATTGAFTIPLMKKVGFAPEFAGAVEAIASTGGMIMPPIMGSAAFLMMQYLGVPFSEIMRAAIIPALLYYFSVYMWVHFTALRIGNRGMRKEDIPPIHDLGRRILLLSPLVAIIIALLMGYTAIYAAFIGILVTILVGFVQQDRLTFKKIIGALASGAKSSLTSMIACIVAGIIVGVCNLTGLGQVITYNITQISGNNLLFALLLTALCCIILSMGLPAAACYILVATIVAPALVRMGVTPMAAHMFVFIFSCYSNITPPVAIASFTAAGLAGARPFDVAMQGLKIAAPGFIIPFMFVYNPSLLLENSSPTELIITVITATLGVLFLAIAGAGYSFHPTAKIIRLSYGLASLLLIIPEHITDAVGVAVLIIAALIDFKSKERTGPSPV